MISSLSLAGSCTFRFIQSKAAEYLDSEMSRTVLRVAAVGAALYAGKRILDALRSPTTLPTAPAAAPVPAAVVAPPAKPKAVAPTPREAPSPDRGCIVQQPEDGNCWLHACIEGLKQLKIPVGDVHTLRNEVVVWMRRHYAHDPQLQEYVARAIEADQNARQTQLEEHRISLISIGLLNLELPPEDQLDLSLADIQEQFGEIEITERNLNRYYTPELYFEVIENNKQFGGAAEFYAISQIYNMSIVIWRDFGSRITMEPDVPLLHDQSRGVIDVVLTPKSDHFNYLALGRIAH